MIITSYNDYFNLILLVIILFNEKEKIFQNRKISIQLFHC